MKKSGILLILIIEAAMSAYSQVPDKVISNLAFMSGTWKTETDWGEMEEHWSEPLGNCMMCSYRCVKDGKVVFYEFIVIEQDSVPIMKLRHFSPGSIGWEDKDKPYEYPLTFLDPDRARFERPDKKTALTFYRTGPDRMKVILERQDKNGNWVEDVFDYKREP
jgi:hypothetical protein